MIPSRPIIFISAVSTELRSTRDLVAKTLLAMGDEPKWQDIAPTETGDLRAVLRKWVDQSHAVLQIVGHRFGKAPKEQGPTFGPVSYTQYEALYAHTKGKKVWYIILDEHHPTDPADPEPEDLKKTSSPPTVPRSKPTKASTTLRTLRSRPRTSSSASATSSPASGEKAGSSPASSCSSSALPSAASPGTSSGRRRPLANSPS